MRRLGDMPEPVSVSARHRWLSMGLFIVKGLMALVVSLGRAKNFRETLERRFGRGA